MPVTTDNLLEICSKIGENKALGLDGILHRSSPDMFTELFKACAFGGTFPAVWKRQKLALLLKAGKPPNGPSSYEAKEVYHIVSMNFVKIVVATILKMLSCTHVLQDRL